MIQRKGRGGQWKSAGSVQAEMPLLLAAGMLARSSSSRILPSAAAAAVTRPWLTSPPQAPWSSAPEAVSEPRRSPPVSPSRHFGDWRSSLSHRALIRSSAAVTEQFERRFATIGVFARPSSFPGSIDVVVCTLFLPRI